jgi:hypothetical protein
MKIDTIRYERKINLGNFEHETIEVTGTPCEGQDAVDAMNELKGKVMQFLTQGQVVVPAKEVVKEVAKPKDRLDNITHTPEGVVENPAQEGIEAAKEDVKKEKKAKVKKEEKVVAGIAYNRELDSHKRVFSDFLTKSYPTWKEDSGLKEKAAKASRELIGKEFLDSKSGALLESFKQEVIKIFS